MTVLFRNASKTTSYIIIVVGTLIILYPIVWVFLNSFKTNLEMFSNPFGFPVNFSLIHYANAINLGNLFRGMLNSLIVTGGTMMILALITPPAAFVLSRPGRLKKIVLYTTFIAIFMAQAVYAIPMFWLLTRLGFADSLLGLILFSTASSIPYCILIIRSGFLGIPRSLEQSASIDGLSLFQTFWKINLPLAMPAVYAALIVEGIFTWNNFFFSLILINSSENFTLPLTMMAFNNQRALNFGDLNAGILISIIPIVVLYVIFSKYIRTGISSEIGFKGAQKT